MKRGQSSTSTVSSVLVIIIVAILLISFAFLGYNQYKTNNELRNAIQRISANYTVNENDGTDTNDANANEKMDTSNSTATDPGKHLISAAEYSNAMVYLEKVLEVSSINNTASLLALVYAILSSLILTYGAKMLRLGENDKEKLIEDLSEKSLKRISSVEDQMEVKTSISNAVVSINSATSLMQLLIQSLSCKDQQLLETTNSSLMDSLSDMCIQLGNVYNTIRGCRNRETDMRSLECALRLLEQSSEIYESKTLPKYIDDKKIVREKLKQTKKKYQNILKYK